MNDRVKKMINGDKKTIIECLSFSGAIFRMDAIACACIHHYKDDEIIKKIKELKNDTISLDGYSVSSFAHAALELLGIEKYTGNNYKVVNLIESNFDFMKP